MFQQILKTKLGKWAVALTVIAIGGIIGCISGGTLGSLPGPLIFLAAAAVLVVVAIKKIQNPPAEPTLEDQGVYVSQEEIDTFITYGTLPKVVNSPVILAQGETAVFACRAERVETKNRKLSTTGSGGGASFRVAKGVTLRTGSTGSKSVYGDVEMIHSGEFVVTTSRIVFVANSRAFEEKLSNLSAVSADGNSLAIMTAKVNYALRMAAPEYPCEIIKHCIRSL